MSSMSMHQPAGVNALLGSPTGFSFEALPPVSARLSPLKSYAAMSNKKFIPTGNVGNGGHEQSRHPVNRAFPGNFFHPPLFPLSHDLDKGDQGLKAMNMSNILNPGGSNVYENLAFVGVQNGENIGDAQGAFSPHKDHIKPDEHQHSVSYEDDENGPSVDIPVSDLENWNIRMSHVQYLPNGYYLFFCVDSNSALQIVNQGQWLIRNTPISIFNWYMGFNPKGRKPTKAPVWVDFVADLPIELYPWLKPVGNSLGRVLGQRSRGVINPKFDPQLLIEIDLSKDLKYAIPVKDFGGRTLHIQKVVYKTLPNACFNCKKLGHFIKECPELKKEDPVPAAIEPEKKDDFQPVGRKSVSKSFKNNKVSSSKNRNSFSPLLEEVFDPPEYTEDHGDVQPQMANENATHSDIQMEFTSNKEIPNPISEHIARGSPLNPADIEKGAASTSSSNGEDDSIPNTQDDNQAKCSDLACKDVSSIRDVPDNQEVYADPSRDESIIVEILEHERSVEDAQSAVWFLQDLSHEQDAGQSLVHEVVLMLISTPNPLKHTHTRAHARMCAHLSISCMIKLLFVKLLQVYLANIRLPNVNSDILVTIYEPLLINEQSESAKVLGAEGAVSAKAAGVMPASEIFHLVLATFKIHDGGLFGN
ncbi:hypothetical protein L7F22_061623 [Adiantum nelumboides]|nr:hypothetical protein [Adiantum nelumboides]